MERKNVHEKKKRKKKRKPKNALQKSLTVKDTRSSKSSSPRSLNTHLITSLVVVVAVSTLLPKLNSLSLCCTATCHVMGRLADTAAATATVVDGGFKNEAKHTHTLTSLMRIMSMSSWREKEERKGKRRKADREQV